MAQPEAATFPVAIWLQAEDSMTRPYQTTFPRDAGMDAEAVMRSIPAMLRTLALEIEQYTDAE